MFSLKITVGVYKKFAQKITIVLRRTYAAPLAATSIFRTGLRLALAMCAEYLAHSVSWCGVMNSPSSGDHFRRRYQTGHWGTFAATRPSSQITLGRLVIFTSR